MIGKSRVNLGIDKQVLERARAAGINISATTEHVLKAMTYSPRGNTVNDMIEAQQKLLESIQLILKRYNASLEIGCITEYESGLEDHYGGKIILFHSGMLVTYSGKEYAKPITIREIWEYLYPPSQIIENLILALIEAAETNREKIMQLEFALRFVKALVSEDENVDSKYKRSQDSLDRRIPSPQSSESQNP